MAGEVSPEKFIEVYEYIMSDEEDRHVSMFIDLHKKDSHPSQFRKTYTDFVVKGRPALSFLLRDPIMFGYSQPEIC
jgi:hypothetical protein